MFQNGELLREFLKSNGIEITKISAQLGVTRQTIDRWLKENENLDKIFEAAARPFLEYLQSKTPVVNEKLVEYQAKKIMELETENEELKTDKKEIEERFEKLSLSVGKDIINLKNKKFK